MNKILGQIALAIGGIVFVVDVIVLLLLGIPVFEAIFRGIVVMCITSMSVAIFFRFFTKVLYKFVAERVMQHSKRGKIEKGEAIGEGKGAAAKV